MASTIGLSPELEREMAPVASREGLSSAEHAALLLLLGRSITKEGRSTPFGHAVADVLASRSLDVQGFATAIDDLIAFCARLSRQDDPGGPEILREFGDHPHADGGEETLRQWRKLAVQIPAGAEAPVDRDLDAVVVELPPLGSMIQAMGRQRRISALGKFAHLPGGSEEFAARKAFEIELEDRPRP